MNATLITALRREEHMIAAELRGSIHFRRLQEIRQLLGLYIEQPSVPQAEETPVGAVLDAMLGDGGHWPGAAAIRQPEVITLRHERAIA